MAVTEVGETEHTKYGRIGQPEFRRALEAILAAGADACLEPRMLDGFSSYSADRNDLNRLSTALDLPHYAFASMVYRGGVCAAIGNASGIVVGYANFVVVYRALAQGEFGRFGQSCRDGRLRRPYAFNVPQGSDVADLVPGDENVADMMNTARPRPSWGKSPWPPISTRSTIPVP